ncbi:Aste57867_12871 [Aphanomyces stellatus]|uniref:Aste57867_12871 protein n=1 Tax=Aphanomyces stellatus TaxID=120398 RepID=A0A485KWP1_9STRA|nr:hypothetical protein As57867_012823 [Aphanomyces stellatus]VFT89718.1 Aste57867_12871 [Aphanomyces stellatus]
MIKAGAVHTYAPATLLASPQWKPCNLVLTSAAELVWFNSETGRADTIMDLSRSGMNVLEIMPWAAMQTATGPQWRLALTTPATGRVFIALDSEAKMQRWVVVLSSVLATNDRIHSRARRRSQTPRWPTQVVC